MRRPLLALSLALSCLFHASLSEDASAQTYISAVGNPSFGVNVPVPNGFINIANGNLHLEIPLAKHKQRGALALNERLIYDSRIWEIVHYSGYYWYPINIPNSSAGWRFVKGNETGTTGTAATSIQNTSCWNGNYSQPYQIVTTYYNWTDPNGTVHAFEAGSSTSYVPANCIGIQGGTSTTTWNGYATDASGYYATVTSDSSNNVSIAIKDGSGNQVYPQVVDRFGNFWTNDANGNLVDDLGRTPVITTVNGNTTYYDVLAPNGPISNNSARVRYTVTTAQVPISTQFQQSGVTEYQNNGGNPSPTIPAIQSIALPDGSSYTFTYDGYGELQSVKLPTGGTVTYGWSNYKDSYQNVNRWISQSTIDGYTTQYTPSVITQCSGNGTGCQETVNVHRPSGDETVYTMTLNNGAWDTNTTVYQGAASANQPKSATVNTYDFSHTCASVVCNGAEYITKAYQTDSLPDAGLSTQTQTSYANPSTGQMTSLAQWDFYLTGSTPSPNPTRQINYGYTGFDLTSETHLDASGNTAASTTYRYTSTAVGTSGVVGHGMTNAGGPYLTSVTATNNAPAGSVTTRATYEDTGALLTTQDANGNPVTTYKYDPTHTFVTEINRPSTSTFGTSFSHISKASFDTNSGAILSSDDENSVANGQAYTVTYSYEPLAGRLQKIQYPKAVPTDAAGGSQTYSYPNPNEVDVAVAQTSSTNITTAQVVDGYGRPIQTSSGGITSTKTYDLNGRLFTITNPSTGSGVTDGTTYTYYDALDRVSSVRTPDNWTRTLQVTGNSALATDEIGHQTKQVFNAFGELKSVFEPDPSSGALVLETDYVRDGLGNLICVEQHGNVAGTGCSSPPSSDATSAWHVRRFFYNSLSQLRAASTPEHTFLPSAPARQNCGDGTGGSQWTDCYNYDSNGNQTSSVDNRGVTRNITFDALNRPLMKTSPNGTTQDLTYDGGALSANAVGHLWHESNDTNAAATYGYDAVGKLISESSCRPSNCATAYVGITGTYDFAGNRTSITYPDGRVIKSNFDTLNRLTSVVYQQWGATAIGSTYWSAGSYAAPGLLQSATYGNGVQMQAGFNNRFSLVSLSYQSTSPAQTFFSKTYQWDKNAANLISETSQTAPQVRQFGYDQLNRLVSAVDVSSGGSKSTATVTISGSEKSYQDCTNAAAPASSSTSGLNATPNYLPPPRCTTVYDTGNVYLNVNGYSVAAPYGKGSNSGTVASSLASLINTSGAPVTASVFNSTVTLYSTTTGANTNYSLSTSSDGDFNASLSGATMTGGSSAGPVPGGLNQQYTLDAWGNLNSMGSSGFTQSINAQNQVSSFNYDAAGRLQNDGVTSYAYDDDGMLVQSSDGASYVYDAVGARAQVARGGVSKEYYYFAGQLIATLNPAQGAAGWTDMINAGGQKIAVVAGNQAAVPVYTLPDHLGSEVASVNSNQTGAAALDYGPFGQVISGSSSDPFVFAGLEHDATGLDHAGFRQYSSATARWTTPDPYNGSYNFGSPQSLNRYSYVGNMPLGFSDRTGLFGEEIAANYTFQIFVSGCFKICAWAGPVGWAAAGVGGLLELTHVLGIWGQPAFHGNLQAQKQGKVTRRTNRCGPRGKNLTAPPGTSFVRNAAIVKYAALTGQLSGPWGTAEVLVGYAGAVWPGIGPWDYKKGLTAGPLRDDYADAGNYNYGVTCAALGLSASACGNAAGQATRLTNGGQLQGPGGYNNYPYGDQGNDEEWVQKGYDDYAKGNVCKIE